MANKKAKQSKKKTTIATKQNAQTDWRESWKAKAPVIRFLLGFMACVVVFYIFYYSTWYEENLRDNLLGFQASISLAIINLMGYGATMKDVLISSADGAFSMTIKNGCDGLEATVLFLAGVLMFPLPMRLKLPGVLVGFAVLFVANLGRIVGLYLIGVHWYDAFEFFHLHGGLILFMVLSVGLWFLWIDWAYKQQDKLATT